MLATDYECFSINQTSSIHIVYKLKIYLFVINSINIGSILNVHIEQQYLAKSNLLAYILTTETALKTKQPS